MPATRSRKTIFALLAILVLVGIVEIFAFLALAVVERGWIRPSERAAERATIAAAARLRDDSTELAGASVSPSIPGASVGMTLHPFVGYAQDPAIDDPFERSIDDQGFFVVPSEPPPPETEVYTIAIFGGSVANHLAFNGRHRLIEKLARAPALAGKTLRIRSLAIGGYKQPQQLNALSYVLAAGERLDMVLNVDGFNDLVLPADNLQHGVYPFYPRYWLLLTDGLVDVERQRRVGEISYLESLRGDAAERFSSAPLRHSALAQFFWRLYDRRLAAKLGAARETLTRPGAERPFRRYGPRTPPREASDRYREVVAFWQRSSRQMDAVARTAGARYYHFLQPNQYLPDSKPMGRAERARAYVEDYRYRPFVERGYPLLLAAGRELRTQGVAFYDLTRIFVDVEQPLYADKCCHLNREGYVLMAEAIAEAILEDLVADRGVRSAP